MCQLAACSAVRFPCTMSIAVYQMEPACWPSASHQFLLVSVHGWCRPTQIGGLTSPQHLTPSCSMLMYTSPGI